MTEKSEESANVGNPVERLVSWIDCNKWEDLPLGDWLVHIKQERKPYAVANVTENNQGHKLIVVGGHFHWDMKPLVAYADFERYKSN